MARLTRAPSSFTPLENSGPKDGGASQAGEALLAADEAVTSLLDEPLGRLRVTAPVELWTRLYSAIIAHALPSAKVRAFAEHLEAAYREGP